MHRVLPLLVSTVGVALLGACGDSKHGIDHPLIFARGELNYAQPCPSWLVSHVSGHRYCASPAIKLRPAVSADAAAPAAPKFDTTKTDQASLMAAGKEVYGSVCAACHQAEGQGMPGQFPPLAGSGEFYGSPENMAKIIVHGLSGEISVQGVTYNGVMPGQGALSDYEIAAVGTYVRNSWGNADGVLLPEVVKAAR